MSKTEKVQGNAIARPPGDDLTVGRELPLPDALGIIERQIRYEEEPVAINEQIPGVLWDAFNATYKAMVQTFKWVHGEKNPGGAPHYTIPSGVNDTITIPVGRFTVKGMDGYLSMSPTYDNRGRSVMGFTAQVKRKDEERVRAVAKLAKEILKKESLYRNKAIKVKFRDSEGEPIPMMMPEFIDVSKATMDSLILNDGLATAVKDSIFTRILYPEACESNGVRTKSGFLLEGLPGTGKTQCIYVAANLCQSSGKRTFIMLEDVDELQEGIRFAESLGGDVLIAGEDIDRVVSGDRDEKINAIFETLDGIESKQTRIMTILTTNNADVIQSPMMRPGRFDEVHTFAPPDAKAAERMIRYYSGHKLVPGTDLTEVCEKLAGQVPAVLMSCVEKATLSQVALDEGKTKGQLLITGEAMVAALARMTRQLALLNREDTGLSVDEALGRLHREIANGNGEHLVVNIQDRKAA